MSTSFADDLNVIATNERTHQRLDNVNTYADSTNVILEQKISLEPKISIYAAGKVTNFISIIGDKK